MVVRGVVITAVAALAAGYLLGRLRPWQRAGDRAADQVRFTGAWVRGGTGRQTVVALAHVVTAPASVVSKSTLSLTSSVLSVRSRPPTNGSKPTPKTMTRAMATFNWSRTAPQAEKCGPRAG